MKELKSEIKYSDFEKIDIRIGVIESAENIEGSEKLVKLNVDFGEIGKRQILAGIAKDYDTEELVGRKTTFVVNMPTRKMMGIESQGMLFAVVNKEDKAILLNPDKELNGGESLC